MGENLVVCDVGNTTLKIGLVKNGLITTTYTLPSATTHTSDSLGLMLSSLLRLGEHETTRWDRCIAVSVVPRLNEILRKSAERFLKCDCLFVPEDIPVPLENGYAHKSEVGADRLLGAWAARVQCPLVPGLVIVDYGTAVTFDCVAGNVYQGGLIFPGPGVASAALAANTAKLPYIDLGNVPVAPMIGRDTATSIKHGFLYGYAAMTESLCQKLLAQLPEPGMVIGTGGFAHTMVKMTSVFGSVEPNLLLEGLIAIYELAKSKQQESQK